MAHIIFTPNLNRHIHCPEAKVEGATVSQILQNYFARYPNVKSYVLDDQNRLRKHMNIAVNNELIVDRIKLTDPVAENDEIFIVQALSGG